MISKKTGLLIMSVLALILSTVPASAVPQLPHSYTGKAYVGGTLAPQGSAVTARAGTSGYNWSTTVANTAGDWTLDITFDDTDTTGTTEGMSAGETVTWSLRSVTARTSTPSTGSTTTGFDLNISASCSDGLQNGDETGVDCGGSCSMACYAMTAALSASTVSVPANSSGSTILTITNTGKNNLTGIAVSVPVFSPTAGSITLTFTAPATTLQTGRNVNVTLNVAVAVNTTESTYPGTINVSANNVTTRQVTITVDTVTAGEVVKRTRRIEISAAGLEGKAICLGAPVLVKAVDERTGDVLDSADVDVYLGADKLVQNKLFYGLTDKNGEYQFTPTEEGDYLITVEKSRYKEAELKISTKSCVAETTTMKATTTTVAVVKTTTTPKYTTSSTVPATTTSQPKVTTTVYKPPVTTVAAVPPVTPKGTSWGTIIVVLIIVVIIVALYMKSKGGAAPAAAEAPKKEEKKK